MSDADSEIFEAFVKKLHALTLTPAHEVAYPNVDADPDARHLRCFLLPAEPGQVTYGEAGKNRHRGLFQISVAWPRGMGEVAPGAAAGAVAAHFKRGTVLTEDGINVRVIRPPYRMTAVVEPTWYVIPVRIPYQADAANPS